MRKILFLCFLIITINSQNKIYSQSCINKVIVDPESPIIDIGLQPKDFCYNYELIYNTRANSIDIVFELKERTDITIHFSKPGYIGYTGGVQADEKGEIIKDGENLYMKYSKCLVGVKNKVTFYGMVLGQTAKLIIKGGSAINPDPEPNPNPSEISFSKNMNYIVTLIPTRETNQLDFSDINSQDPGLQIGIEYFDGIGRSVQKIAHRASPKFKDIVSIQEYDSFGRSSKAWLPAVTSSNGAYSNPETIKEMAKQINNDQMPFSEPIYEPSPLNRTKAQYGPGQDWHASGKAVKYIYGTNIGGTAPANQLELDSSQETSGIVSACDKIILSPGFQFQATPEKSLALFIDPSQCETQTMSLFSSQEEQIDPAYLTCNFYKIGGNKLIKSGSYPAGELFITQVSDEDDNKSLQFKNKLGQVILTRQINENEKYDTYYVYDDYGNLRYVLPPMVVDQATDLSDNSEVIKQFAYIYKYDTRNRCIWKRLPGCDPIQYIYDKADRLIFSQNGEQKLKGEWHFSIPDSHGRIVLTGICKNNLNPAADNPLGDNVIKATWNKQTNVYKGYTISGIELTSTTILTVNYYDNYEFLGLNSLPDTISNSHTKYEIMAGYGKRYTGGYKGFLTGTLVGQYLPDNTVSKDYLYSVMYYDERGRAIQIKSINHLGGTEAEFLAYNFTGQPIQRMHIHSATGKATQTETYTYAYDHALRLIKTTHKLNNNAETILAENTYDELGRLKTNKKAGQANLTTTYGYNVRSWTKTIASPLFNQTLYYNDQYAGSAKRYNGNVGAMTWQVKDQTTNNWDKLRGYTFTYDNISQLTAANYLENGTACNNYKTQYTYDKHGNIHSLQRYGKISEGNSSTDYGWVDKLTMTYAGNQLVKATDSGVNVNISISEDFKDRENAAVEYTYNRNGAMTKDLNKGITGIKYNSLNLPVEIQVSNSETQGWSRYLYSASGVKLRVESQSSIDMLNAPMAGTLDNTYATIENKKTDYVGNMIYENGQLAKILVDGGYYNIPDKMYHLYLTDHLGNNRMVVKQDTRVVQKNHYYPFGMTFAEGNIGYQPYKYNGKEQDRSHGLNHYDYSARYYNPDIPRFTSIDPLAEKYPHISPYAYVENNPLKYIDPTGKEKLNGMGKKGGGDKMVENRRHRDNGMIHIYAHGHIRKNAFEFIDTDGNKTVVSNSKELIGLLNDYSAIWNNREQGEELYIVLHSCYVGSQKSIVGVPLAMELSLDLPDHIIVAGTDAIDIYEFSGEAVINGGYWTYYKDGLIVKSAKGSKNNNPDLVDYKRASNTKGNTREEEKRQYQEGVEKNTSSSKTIDEEYGKEGTMRRWFYNTFGF